MINWKEIDKKAHNYCVVIGYVILIAIISLFIYTAIHAFFSRLGDMISVGVPNLAAIELGIVLCHLAIVVIPIGYFISKISKGFKE